MNIKIYNKLSWNADESAQKVFNVMQNSLNQVEGIWLYREPDIKTEGNDLPTFTIMSPQIGLLFIRIYSYHDDELSTANDKYWEINGNKYDCELRRIRNYVHAMKSKLSDPINELDEIPVRVWFAFPNIKNKAILEHMSLKAEEKVMLFEELPANISGFLLHEGSENIEISPTDYSKLVSIVQGANILNKPSNVYIDEPAKNMGEAISLNNKKIARFDEDQLSACLTITDRAERIRGLPGSGKTVLLAIKAARLHKNNPEKKIAFVFYTKSLYNQAKSLIRRYYWEIADEEPNWENLMIMHSWGGATTGIGFYSYVCAQNNVRPITLDEGSLGKGCRQLLDTVNLKELFDYILIDEGQDFPLDFFLLAEKVLKVPKKVVVAYDELQTTNNVVIPEFEILFGGTKDRPNIPLDDDCDFVLRKAYRNGIEVLETAISFGFGFYHNIIQMIQKKETWSALGFEVKGELKYQNDIVISRPRENSPNSIMEIYNKIEPVNVFISDSDDGVVLDVAKKIKVLLDVEKVKPTDILVIDVNMNKNNILSSLQFALSEKNIQSHIPGISSDARTFFRDNNITLSTPRNSKGNEVPVVFVVGCENIYTRTSRTEYRKNRNFLFISLTRSMGWVYLYAAGRVKTAFEEEYKKIRHYIPEIHFSYPSEEQEHEFAKIDYVIKSPNADIAKSEIQRFKKALSNYDAELVKTLIDFDPELKRKLEELLNGKAVVSNSKKRY